MKKAFIWTFITLLTFGSAPMVSADEITDLRNELQQMRQDYESRIKTLESRLQSLTNNQDERITKVEEKVDKKLLDVEYVGRYEGPFKKGGLLIKNPSGFGNVSLGGYVDMEFENFKNVNSTFDQHRWIINVGAELTDRLKFYSEYEIEHGGPNASGGGSAKVEQATIDYLINERINLRTGALLVPFGRYNIYHDSDLQDLTDRPLVNRDIIPTTWTESGVGFFGEFNPIIGDYEDLILDYETYVINGLDDGFSDTGMGSARGSIESDNNNSKAVVGRLLVSPFLGHEFGLSGYWGKYNSDDDQISGLAFDWNSKWGPLELVGEYAHFDIDNPDTSDVTDTMQGYYAQANYHFWPEFLNKTFLGKTFENPTFTISGRYGWVEIEDDSDAGLGDNRENRMTLGLNYRPIESWVFKLEYQWNDTENEALERGNNNGFMSSVAMGF